MKKVTSKSIKSKDKPGILKNKPSTLFIIIAIAVVLFIIPWVILQHIPPVLTAQGYVTSLCVYPYTYELIVGTALILTAVSWLLSFRLIKNASNWQVFIIFEFSVMLSTVVIALITHGLCTPDPTSFFY